MPARDAEKGRLAICGAAHVHLPDHVRMARDHSWTIGGVFDRDEQRGRDWCDRLGANWHGEAAELAGAGYDGAIVCSETAHHEADMHALVEAGIPVFAEKPLAHDAASARRIADAAERTGTTVHTGFFMRTNTALAELCERVREGVLGDIVEARARFSHDGAFARWLDLSGWMTTPQLAGYGGFADEGVHAIDLLQWMLGPIADGQARLGFEKGYPVDDHGAAVLAFESGAIGAVQAGWTDTRMRLELDLVGTEGGARVRQGLAEAWDRQDGTRNWSAELASLDAGEGLVPFLDALQGKDGAGLVTACEAVAVNAVLDMLYGRPSA
ncbi:MULTISPECIES: Gfo/Idh/MocA family oxidoreductase [unclassified Roseitalea]|uniref:Gfo/Idh/MocA family protein n=1 Tax=unclassified Roseitalea TaxID=2639107 RepID=UPI00273E075C|nr:MULTISPECIES: Gfo/Idh/MocA family oxidoreductase [unclassified Roseitalea]